MILPSSDNDCTSSPSPEESDSVVEALARVTGGNFGIAGDEEFFLVFLLIVTTGITVTKIYQQYDRQAAVNSENKLTHSR